jgi:hypothetical protein
MTTDNFTLLTGKQPRGATVILYGNPGIGKTTLASQAPGPVLIDIEGGAAQIDVPKTPQLATWKEVYKWMAHLHTKEDKSIKTIIFDTIDVLETYIHDDVCKSNGKDSIEKFPYGSGYKMAIDLWRQLIRFSRDQNLKGRNVILIAHEQVKRYENPMSEGYDRYQIKINHNSSNILVGAADAVLFAHWKTIVKDDDREMTKKAIGTGERLLQCLESPAVTAKNRYNLKPIEKMDKSIWEKMK